MIAILGCVFLQRAGLRIKRHDYGPPGFGPAGPAGERVRSLSPGTAPNGRPAPL